MDQLTKNLQRKIEKRKENNSLRSLGAYQQLIDFSSNDYLGFASSGRIYQKATQILKEYNFQKNGATGSRLLSGNSKLYEDTEKWLANFHQSEACLIFNSGYDANIGFFSCVPQKGDLIFYDELIHASIRDGIGMSNAKAFKFKHNDLEALKAKCQVERSRNLFEDAEVYIITESVFSMDGDSPDLKAMSDFCHSKGYHLVVDEAHALGVTGSGKGIAQELQIENKVFARIVTFGKALGCHGAAIMGSYLLKSYLINFCRSFIYTTALPPHSVATIKAAYDELNVSENLIKLNSNIAILHLYIRKYDLTNYFIESFSAIHCCIIPGNDAVKKLSEKIKNEGFDVKPILSPTVPEGKERLRICIHSFNSEEEIEKLVQRIATFTK